MNIESIYQDYNILIADAGHKHYREGWINTECPYCIGNPGYHLGYNINDNYFYCWRCGWHPLIPTLSKLLNIDYRETYAIVQSRAGFVPWIVRESANKIVKRGHKEHKLPIGVGSIGKKHRKYIESRNMNPDEIEREWRILGTGPVAPLDNIDFKHRIIIPIFWDGRQVSYQSRDITDKHQLKYITCPKNRELVEHKTILYGRQECWRDSIIVVEGAFDVWRLGPKNAVATFGISFTNEQRFLLRKQFKRILIFYDDDKQALEQANRLYVYLRQFGVNTGLHIENGDPGSITQKDADQITRRFYSNQWIMKRHRNIKSALPKVKN